MVDRYGLHFITDSVTFPHRTMSFSNIKRKARYRVEGDSDEVYRKTRAQKKRGGLRLLSV